jgi:hypothetical protein
LQGFCVQQHHPPGLAPLQDNPSDAAADGVAMFSKVVAPFFTYRQAQFDIVDGVLEWCIDLTAACSAADIAVVSQLPVMPPQKGPVNLTLTDP